MAGRKAPQPVEITAETDFKHDRTAYRAGMVYTVDFATAAYFVGNGWATAAEIAPPATAEAPASKTLHVHDAVHAHDAESPGGEK